MADFNSFFGIGSSSGGGGFGFNLMDYMNIRNGSYGKLLRAHYYGTTKERVEAKGSNTATKPKEEYKNPLEKSENKPLATAKSDADSLKASADKLITKGDKSLFVEKNITTTDEDGNKVTSKGYDMDAIAKSVNNFVSDYNSVLDSASNSGNSSKMD